MAQTTRRGFLLSAAAACAAGQTAATMSHKERVDRALKGTAVDRPPFTFWHHFGLEKKDPSGMPRPLSAFTGSFAQTW